jgi:hypothetical protein
MGKELAELHDVETPIALHHDAVNVACEIHEKLPTGSAWWGDVGVACGNRDRPE